MKNRIIIVVPLLFFLLLLTGTVRANSLVSPDQQALVYVKLDSPGDMSRFASTELPMFAEVGKGLLSGADLAGRLKLVEAGLIFQVLDPELGSGTYYWAEIHSSRPAPDFAQYGQVLLEIDPGVLLKMDSSQVVAATQAGAELRLITLSPKPLPNAQLEAVFPNVIEPDPDIQDMIDQVTPIQVSTYDRQLAGELPVWVDGDWYTITSRTTYSGEPIQKTTHFVGQQMAADGLDVEYHVWNGPTNPNVIGELPGETEPDRIFIIGAHVDDVSGTPGADDNASGSVATLMAANILTQFDWSCTLRFAFWTGEEQGLLGSEAYANRSYQRGENIVGYLNLDMIAWNTLGSEPYINLIYSSSLPPTHDLALLFADVIGAYNLDLLTRLGTGISGSDHSSFWQFGYTSILAIEDDLGNDFNPYYHSPNDTPAHTDLGYFTNFVKASIATYAHMSGCLIPPGRGSLEGHVTAASGGAPIQSASVTAEDSLGQTFPASTDETGYYSSTLDAGTYTVTAEAFGYIPSMVSGVIVTTDTVTIQNFALQTAPNYTVSGYVREEGTGLPLLAEISFESSPITVWTDPFTGYYQAELPEGAYTMQVNSYAHHKQERVIIVDQDQTQDFDLERNSCILLVDDDQNAPDTRINYTTTLDSLGVDYDIWDISLDGDPGYGDLSGYNKVLWYTGAPSEDTFTPENEASVAAYLDEGGNFFLSSQDYLTEYHLTPFGQNYLHIGTYMSNIHQTSIEGRNIFAGLGPYMLNYPFTNTSDRVNPDGQSLAAFLGNYGYAGISFSGESFKSVFIGYPFETISTTDGRQAVMDRLLEYFGSCALPIGWLDGHITDASTGGPLGGVEVTAVSSKTGHQGFTDPNGYYNMTLPADTYTVTAALEGYVPQTVETTVFSGEITTQDFALQPEQCAPLTSVDFTWQPLEPYVSNVITFTATASGTEPIDFTWDYGDSITATGKISEHAFQEAGSYLVSLSAENACSEPIQVDKNLTVSPHALEFFLPVVVNNRQ